MDKKRLDIISVLSIIAVLAITYSVFLRDDISSYRSLRKEQASLRSGVINTLYDMGARKERESAIVALEKEVREDRRFLQIENSVPYFLNYISSLARRHEIDIVSIDPGESVADDSLTRHKFTAVVSGKFPDIYDFLYYLEDEWRAVKVETLVMDKLPEDKGVNAVITLTVLYMEGHKEKV